MRKKYLLFCILLDIIAVALIPVNLLLVAIPEYVEIALALLIIATVILFTLKARRQRNTEAGGHSRKASKVVVSIFSVFAVLLSVLGSCCLPYWNSIMFRINADYYSKPYDYEISADEAKEDLEYAMKYLKKLHPALYGGIPKDLSLQYANIAEELEQCGSISVNELCRKIESIFSVLGDGHTYILGNYADRRIMKYYRQWTGEGYAITGVNGISVEQLLAQNSAYYSFEVEQWEYEWLSDDIVTVAGLDYLGFDVENGIEYTLTSQSGQTRTEICFLEDYLIWDEYAEFNHIDDSEPDEESFVRYTIDKENSLAVLTLDECTYNNEYIECVRKLFEEVKAMNIQNVAVDLRNNGGGSDLVVSEFFKYLDIDSYQIVSMGWRLGFLYLNLGSGVKQNDRYEELLFDGKLYLLTSAGTFSSAMEFAEYVKDNAVGTIIGEAPGNMPNGYGEVAVFQLPHSKLCMQISTKRFYRADRSCTDELVTPDIECDSDEALEELYKNLLFTTHEN